MKLALDANLFPHLAHAVHQLFIFEHGEGISIPERFGRGVADRDWIVALYKEGGWAVLTQDRKLRTRPHERRALEQSDLVVFILESGCAKESYWIKAAGVVRWLPPMLDAFRDVKPPVLLAIPHRWKPVPLRPFR